MKSGSSLLASLFVACALSLFSARARAETLQAPFGGKPIALGGDRVACGAPPAGWSIEQDGHAARPPAAESAVGQIVELRVAATAAACAASKETLSLITTGRWPAVDPAGTLISVDDARLEIRGRGLRGARVAVRAAGHETEDVCLDPKPDGASERCVLAPGRGLPADPSAITLSFTPAGARTGADVSTFDAEGRRATAADFALAPPRIAIASLLPGGAAVDFAADVRRVVLTHPEAVTSVECGPAQCEVAQGGVTVRGLGAAASSLGLRFKLLPRVALTRGEALDPTPTVSVPVLQCPLSVISGPPLRGVEDARVVVRLAGGCARDARALRFRVGSVPVDPIRVVADGDAADVILRVGRFADEAMTITALRPEPDVSTVGVARTATQAVDPPRASLELPGYGAIDFIPTNRSARVRLAGGGEGVKLVLLPLVGVYDTASEGGAITARGVASAGGLVALRFAYRAVGLPSALGDVDLGLATEAVERPVRPVNLPAPLGALSVGAAPLVTLECDTGESKLLTVRPGTPAHVPFGARDGCRLVFHRERLAEDYGTQKLSLDIDVTRADGTPVGDARVSQPVVLRPGGETRVAWIHGITEPFERVSVRLSHSADEAHYVAGVDLPAATPSVQWAVIMGTGRARLYATTAIPTGLYRVSDREHSGILTLNFGVLGRLTWLDADGDEGVLGLEAGVMGVGLANDTSSTGRSLTQVATVAGVSLGVPIANRGALTETSINLHAWFEFEPSRALGNGEGSPLGFVFGPSITIGNIGANL